MKKILSFSTHSTDNLQILLIFMRKKTSACIWKSLQSHSHFKQIGYSLVTEKPNLKSSIVAGIVQLVSKGEKKHAARERFFFQIINKVQGEENLFIADRISFRLLALTSFKSF